jgi:hypothetical protein
MVPRLIVAVACIHIFVGLLVRPDSLDPNPLTGIARDGFVNSIAANVDREATFWFLATGVFFGSCAASVGLLKLVRAGAGTGRRVPAWPAR